jgi:hypothetical protein
MAGHHEVAVFAIPTVSRWAAASPGGLWGGRPELLGG